MPRNEIDGWVLRPLLAQGWVTELADVVRPTSTGRAFATRLVSAADDDEVAPAQAARLSRAQEEFLRYLVRQTGPVLEDHADGRVVRGLLARGLVRRSAGWISPTEAVAAQLATRARQAQTIRTRRASRSPQTARADAVLRAVEQLEAAVPRDAELFIGGHPAYADDVLAGLRRFAREMESSLRGSV